MFLMKEILDLGGISYLMVGLFPVAAQTEDRLKAVGYHWGSNPDVAGHFVHYCRRHGNAP